jgi:Protein of unknown function (DUF3300)
MLRWLLIRFLYFWSTEVGGEIAKMTSGLRSKPVIARSEKRPTHLAVLVALSVLLATPPVFCDENAPQASTADSTQPDKPLLQQAELDQIVAPIALYPDALLSQVLMASTYPLEIVQADRWVQQNKTLQGDALAMELEKQTWDPSVKSLVNFPQTLDMMSDKLDWTVKLGDAFLSQQQDVMNTVQSLRAEAQAQGNLQSNDQQTVTVDSSTAGQPQIIVIQPANPQVIYVPTYNPTIVYGPWPYPAYPPYCYYPPGYVAGRTAIWFGVGLAAGMAWGYAWGGFDWHHRSININVNRNININTRINRTLYQNNYRKTNVNMQGGQGTWRHDPSHRQGVAYGDRSTASRFGAASSPQGVSQRDAFRGRTDAGGQTPTPGFNHPPVGNSPPSANRPPVSNRSGGPSNSSTSATRGGAFDQIDRGGAGARADSQRGQASRAGGSGKTAGRPARRH